MLGDGTHHQQYPTSLGKCQLKLCLRWCSGMMVTKPARRSYCWTLLTESNPRLWATGYVQWVFCSVAEYSHKDNPRIHMGTARLVRLPPYRIPHALYWEYVKNSGWDMETIASLKIIEPSISEWAAPVVLVHRQKVDSVLTIEHRILSPM